jgi:hypothetical protein
MITTDKTLVDAATEDCRDDEFRRRYLAEIETPDWGNMTATVGCGAAWDFFVPDVIADRWASFPIETRLAIFLVAKRAADLMPG